jgi:soluble lytic murein transglycosylase-like protein
LTLKISFLLLFALTFSSGYLHAAMYRYVDSAGVVKVTDQVPVGRRYMTINLRHAAGVPHEPAAYPTETRSRYAAQVHAAARETELEPALIHAVISAESGYNPSARSPAGAVGLMQLMPQTAARYQVKDSLDPAANIRGGTRYLRDLLKMFDNDLSLALAAYNAGEHAVIRHGNRIPPYRETARYVPRVLAYYRKYLTNS